jgi:Zn-dependent alcohol dehydrogenase
MKMNGARLAGAEKIVAVDIVEAKRDKAFEFGATHFATSMQEATELVGELLGSLYGEANPRADIPRLLSLYREGKLLLDETVTAEYKLNDINEAYDDMLAGRNIRGVVIHDH